MPIRSYDPRHTRAAYRIPARICTVLTCDYIPSSVIDFSDFQLFVRIGVIHVGAAAQETIGDARARLVSSELGSRIVITRSISRYEQVEYCIAR